jgi:hypothetical protein
VTFNHAPPDEARRKAHSGGGDQLVIAATASSLDAAMRPSSYTMRDSHDGVFVETESELRSEHESI